MTSLIDVIFLLLLFFMLSSTFSRFAEVPLPLGGTDLQAAADEPPLFLRIEDSRLTLNGRTIALTDLAANLQGDSDRVLIVSVTQSASAQRLTDVLVGLRGIENLTVNVLVPT